MSAPNLVTTRLEINGTTHELTSMSAAAQPVTT
jgi:hypothetical protein